MNEDLREELIAIADEYRDGIFNRPKMEAAITAALSAVAPPPVLEDVSVAQATAPERIWLAVSDDTFDAEHPFPGSGDWEHVCWSADAPLEVCVPYIRADLAASPAAPAQPEGGDALVEFFRGEGQRFGLEGDARGWTPEQTAIEVMRRHMAKPAAEADPSDSRLPWKDPRDFANDGNPTRCAAIWNEAVAETSAALTRPAPAQQDEMKELLHSTHEIALRGGADTDWEALAKSIAKLGISPITARHYFAEGTPRETINKHLDALLSRVNAARRAALASNAAASAADAQEGK